MSSRIVVSTMKNEGPYLLEWIAHHLSVGFDHFVIYSNDCSDGTNLMLNRLDQLGLVTHYDNPLGPDRRDPQRSAYSRAKRAPQVVAADWVMVIDADEFVNIRAGSGRLDDLLAACPGADAISLVWQQIGSCGKVRFEAEPVTGRFDRAANLQAPENGLVTGFKTLFRRAAFDYFGVHRPRFLKKRKLEPGCVRWVNGSGVDMGDSFYRGGWRFGRRNLGYDLGLVNHYAIKAKEDFLLKKARGTANAGKNAGRIDLDYWRKYDLNSVPAIPLQDSGMVNVLAELKSDPILAALHEASVENARRQIALCLEDPEMRAFVEGAETDAGRDVA